MVAAVWGVLGVGWRLYGWGDMVGCGSSQGWFGGWWVWREWVSCTVVAFGVCCWDGMVVGVDCWLLAGCWWVVVAVASVVRSDGGGSGVSVGRLWCG